MNENVEKYRRWIRESEHRHARTFYYLAQGIMTKLGNEKGTALLVQQVKEMGKHSGQALRLTLENQGLENSFTNYTTQNMSNDAVYALAWEGRTQSLTDEEWIIDWTYCPLAEGFKTFGDKGIVIGEIFCNHIDNAKVEAYNSEYMCIRERSLNLNGVCRLHFQKKLAHTLS